MLRGERAGVAWSERASAVDAGGHDLGGAACGTHHDRPPARHALGDRQAERFGLGAGVNDDVERANRRRGIVDEAREADAIREAEPRRRLPAAPRSTPGFPRSRTPARRSRRRGRSSDGGSRAIASRKTWCPFHTREGGDEADADDVAAAGGKTRDRIVEIESRRRPERSARGRRRSRSRWTGGSVPRKRSKIVGDAPRGRSPASSA